MARPLRVEYPGAVYHLMGRGNHGEAVFAEEPDAGRFLTALAETAERFALLVHAYCLMRTHYHLLAETPGGNLVASMKWLLGTFTQRHNAARRTRGHLFQGRYKAKVVDAGDPGYFDSAARYIHLNPAAAGLVGGEGEGLAGYRWSSFPAHVSAPSARPAWLRSDRVLECAGFRDTPAGRKAYAADMEARALETAARRRGRQEDALRRRMERGWCHGDAAFREMLVERIAESDPDAARPSADAEQRRDRTTQAARRHVRACLAALGLSETDLAKLPKGDARKLLVAGLIRRRHPVPLAWVSKELHMGHLRRVTHARAWAFDPPREWRSAARKLEGILGI